VRIGNHNRDDFRQDDIRIYSDDISDTPVCEFHLEQDESGYCIKDRCSNWDIVLGECTERQSQLGITS
jgi:hypothetical protein